MIDTAQINQQVNLLALIAPDTTLRRVAGTNGGEWAGPCPWCGGRDRFRVQPHASDGGRWFCRSCTGDPAGGGQWHDAIAYVMKRERLEFREACERLAGPGTLPTAPVHETAAPASSPAPDLGRGAPSKAWQEAAAQAVEESHRRLLEGIDWIDAHPQNLNQIGDQNVLAYLMAYWKKAPPAARAFHWLQQRGLTRASIIGAGLGFNPEWCEVLPDHKLAPGITIPCWAAGALWYVNVRVSGRFSGRIGKYRSLKGSALTSLYQADDLLPARHAVIVEGEFDALLLKQHVGDLAAVATMGAAGVLPKRWRLYFGHLTSLFVFLDQDETGQRYVGNWRDVAQMMPPGPGDGQDVTDFYQAGGDLRGWVLSALRSTTEAQRLVELEQQVRELPPSDEAWAAAVQEYGVLYERVGILE